MLFYIYPIVPYPPAFLQQFSLNKLKPNRNETDAYSNPFRAGEHNTNTVEGNEQDIQVKKIFKYGGYYKGNLRNDIALLQLSSAIQFGTHVQPVCLPSQGDRVPVGSSCYITGRYPRHFQVFFLYALRNEQGQIL